MPAYWVNSAACVDVARNKITHKLAHGELIETEPWLKDGPITIGTAFRCTPTRKCSPKMLFQQWHSTPALRIYCRIRPRTRVPMWALGAKGIRQKHQPALCANIATKLRLLYIDNCCFGQV